nr:unnamed protein product [Callosobruchus chinensis]
MYIISILDNSIGLEITNVGRTYHGLHQQLWDLKFIVNQLPI